jgi:hypothetical protein
VEPTTTIITTTTIVYVKKDKLSEIRILINKRKCPSK